MFEDKLLVLTGLGGSLLLVDLLDLARIRAAGSRCLQLSVHGFYTMLLTFA